MNRRDILKAIAAASTMTLASPHVARAATRKLRIGHNNSTSSGFHIGAVALQKYVAEKTDGRYNIEIFPMSQLGTDTQMAKAVSEGTLDMTVSPGTTLGMFDPELALSELPYLFKDADAARQAFAGNLGAHYTELLKKNSVTAFGWAESGFRHVTANKPIRKVSDLKNVKIRIQNAKLQVESFLGLGAAAEPLSFGELPEALRTGKFDAQENPLAVIVANDWIAKSQTHLSMTSHVYSSLVYVVSSDVMDELAPADREIIKAGGLAAVKAVQDFSDDAAKNGVEKLKAAGMTIVADVDRADFKKAMEGVNDRLVALVGADAMGRIRSLTA